jgi:N-acetylmuramic acid 6-phosphate etherase
MIDVMLTNEKLRDRALRILAEASSKDLSSAKHALRQSGHNLRVALVMLRLGLNTAQARTRLKNAKGNLRRALGE